MTTNVPESTVHKDAQLTKALQGSGLEHTNVQVRESAGPSDNAFSQHKVPFGPKAVRDGGAIVHGIDVPCVELLCKGGPLGKQCFSCLLTLHEAGVVPMCVVMPHRAQKRKDCAQTVVTRHRPASHPSSSRPDRTQSNVKRNSKSINYVSSPNRGHPRTLLPNTCNQEQHLRFPRSARCGKILSAPRARVWILMESTVRGSEAAFNGSKSNHGFEILAERCAVVLLYSPTGDGTKCTHSLSNLVGGEEGCGIRQDAHIPHSQGSAACLLRKKSSGWWAAVRLSENNISTDPKASQSRTVRTHLGVRRLFCA